MAKQKQPNILIIWGDDIGITNLSCYSDGLMGYRTPNIDRIANEGMRFTDSYGQQSCTAGRAAFITGQSPYRTGLTKVGMPGADIGLQAEDATIAELLKPLGYATGQFGKNHFGDKNKYLPTAHGFDEFFGNLYHLNAEEEPENVDYPTDADFPDFKKVFGPRGVMHSWATEKDDPTEHPRWGRVGKQKIEDTGPLTKKRMETCDTEFVGAAKDFIKRAHKAEKPFFVWLSTTWMHFRVHPPKEILGQAGRWQSFYHDVMVEHDKHVGQMLDLLDELGIAKDTIVMYSTDNGPHMNTWPDGAMTPFRNEKNSNWEGAFRVPMMVRWPGKIKAGTVSNEMIAHQDWLPTLLAAAGEPAIGEKLKKGHTAGDKTFKVHLDGYNFLPHFTGKAEKGPRPGLRLLLGRRRPGRAALRQLEIRLRRAALRGHGHDLGGALHLPAHTQGLQPAHGPLRTGGHHLQHLLGLDDRPGLSDLCGAVHREAIPGDLQGVPAAHESGELRHRPGAEEDGAGVEHRLTRTKPPGAAPPRGVLHRRIFR